MLLRQQVRSVFRDRFSGLLVVLPLVLTAIPVLVLPILREVLAERIGFDLHPHFPAIKAVMVMVIPFLLGLCFAFLLIDERDRGIFETIQITPSGLERYLAARLLLPLGLSFVYSLLLLPVFLSGDRSGNQLFWSATIAALECPLWALMILAFSRNKVGAMAVGKGMTLLAMVPVVSLYVPPPSGLLFAGFPTYWLFRAFIDPEFSEGAWPLPGVALHLWLIFRFWRRSIRRAEP